MTTYQYTDSTNTVVHVIDEDGISRMSCLASVLPEGTEVAAYVQPPVDLKAKVDALWKAADAYTSSYISGVAIGLLTIGVIQGKPKALAISAWSKSVWDEYYTRKALVTATSVDNHDFSSFGPIPYSVPELQAELGI